MASKVRILFLGTNPKDTKTLRLDEEIREIQQHIRAAEFRDNFEFFARMAVRPRDLLQAFNEVKPDIVHFSGHGTPDACLLLEDQAGNATPVSDDALEGLFRSANENIRLVVMNTCNSELQARVVANYVDCAVGMRVPIGDEAAVTFASSFYGALAFGIPVGRAFEQGKTALLLDGISEQNTPSIVTRAGLDALAVTFGNHCPIRPCLPQFALEILIAAVESNSPIQFVTFDGGAAVLTGQRTFESGFNWELANQFEEAVEALAICRLIRPRDRNFYLVTSEGRRLIRGSIEQNDS